MTGTYAVRDFEHEDRGTGYPEHSALGLCGLIEARSRRARGRSRRAVRGSPSRRSHLRSRRQRCAQQQQGIGPLGMLAGILRRNDDDAICLDRRRGAPRGELHSRRCNTRLSLGGTQP